MNALTWALVATAALAALTGSILWLRRDKPTPAELERRRRLAVNRTGRIVEGRIIELRDGAGHEGASPLLVYNYSVRGVEYQAAQDVSFLRGEVDLSRMAAGQAASIKVDPQNPTNSIVLCEEWSGV
jgi:hypothetical protein